MPNKKRPGLWANIHAKRKRIAAGSGERMRKPGEEGAPTPEAIKRSQEKRAALIKEAIMKKLAEKKNFQLKSEHKNPKGGLNAKGRAAYNKATGGNLKPPQPKGGARRDSFCARMKGMKAKLTSAKTANDPNSRINKALRAWNC